MRSSVSSSNTPAETGRVSTVRPPDSAEAFAGLLARVTACTACAEHLPHPPRPVLRASPGARLLIVGQAPGRRVHATGIPWNDPSGDRLRDWLGLTRDAFYDASRIAIVPAGLCYPGTVNGSDLPPRAECAPRWHPTLRAAMPRIALTLVIGAYAQAYYLGRQRRATLAETVGAWRDFGPALFPLPHPSPRNRRWFKQHPWFDAEVVPLLRARVGALLSTGDNEPDQ